MAAHIVTALTEIQKDTITDVPGTDVPDFYWRQLQTALDLSCWTEDLDLDEWRELQRVVDGRDSGELRDFVAKCLPIYQAEWERLGQPRTREEWGKRRRISRNPDLYEVGL
jgi:hypothetical protein